MYNCQRTTINNIPRWTFDYDDIYTELEIINDLISESLYNYGSQISEDKELSAQKMLMNMVDTMREEALKWK